MAAGYLGLVSAAGVSRRARRQDRPAKTRFAVMIPAHNEAAVIGDCLQSLRHVDYCSELYDVHVVADNCTDQTAEMVRAAGWTVHERVMPDQPGKGHALNWLFDRLDQRAHFDVAVIIDADTVVDPGFLTAMDGAFRRGALAGQGFYSVRDPGDSPIAGLRYVALACRHHLRPMGRTRLGGSSGLYGNGMAFEWSILRRRRWTGHLVEDAEFQLELLLHDDVIVTYVPEALLVAEMPMSLESAASQNERWERGRLELTKRYLPRLVRKFRHARANRRVAVVDAAADLLLPPLSVLAAMLSASLTLNATSSLLGDERAQRRLRVDLLAIAVLAGHVYLGLLSVKAPRSVYRSLASAPKVIAWKLRLWMRMLSPAADVAWVRTERNADR
jgi:cellulose synthase/poly-beta-1,6-N-acetylglucosamine synthase-like glycosyltransferase